MNKIYSSVWNESLGAWVAVSEIVRGHPKSQSIGAVKVAKSTRLVNWPIDYLFKVSSVFLACFTFLQPSFSQNLCGDAPLNNIVVCNGSGSPATNTSPYPNIIYTDPVFLTIDGSTSPIILNGIVSVYSEGTSPVSIDLKGKVTQTLEYTSRSVAIGQYESYQVPHSIKISIGPEVTLNNDYLSPTGVFYNVAAKVDNNEVDINSSGKITSLANNPIEAITSPMFHAGILAFDPTGGANSKISVVNSGNISITSEGGKGGKSAGIFALSEGLGSPNVVNLENSGSVTVSNTAGISTLTGSGLWATNTSTGGISVNNTGLITGKGDWKNLFYGIYASAYNGDVEVNTGNINLNTLGPNRGVEAKSAKKVTVNVTGNIYALGEKTTSIGVFIEPVTINNVALGSYEINVSAGKTILSNGMSIGVNSPDGGVINLGSNSRIDNYDHSPENYAIYTSVGKDIINSQALITGVVDTNSGDDEINFSAGALNGSVSMGAGNDQLIVSGSFNSSNVSLFDGQTGDDTLEFSGASGNFYGSRITNWESIKLTNNANITFSGGELTLDTSSFSDGIERGFLIDSSSALNISNSFVLNSPVNNAGTINLRSKTVGKTFTINGNYTGSNGVLLLNAKLNGDENSITDKLVVNGNTAGTTVVKVNNILGKGEATTNGVQIIEVSGNSNGVFSLDEPVQAGSWEYILNKKGNSWFLESSYYPEGKSKDYSFGKPFTITPDKPDSLSSSAGSPSSKNGEIPRIYRPGVSAYVVAQNLNNEILSLSAGSLQSRLGEQYNAQVAACLPGSENDSALFAKNMAWGRYSVSSLKLSGLNQFELESDISMLQVGTDLLRVINPQDLSRRQIGVFVNLGASESDTGNRARELAKLAVATGEINSRQIGLGSYLTHYTKNGEYINWVGQINQINSDYTDIYQGRSQQKSYSVGTSLDWGKPQKLGQSKWLIEPQAQAQYHLSSHSGFKDSVSTVDSYFSHSAIIRLGGRLTWNSTPELPTSEKDSIKQNTIYTTVSVAKEILSNSSVNIGGTKVLDELSDSPWLEVGLGGQIPIFENAYIFGQIQAQKNLGGSKRSALSSHFGFRYNW